MLGRQWGCEKKTSGPFLSTCFQGSSTITEFLIRFLFWILVCKAKNIMKCYFQWGRDKIPFCPSTAEKPKGNQKSFDLVWNGPSHRWLETFIFPSGECFWVGTPEPAPRSAKCPSIEIKRNNREFWCMESLFRVFLCVKKRSAEMFIFFSLRDCLLCRFYFSTRAFLKVGFLEIFSFRCSLLSNIFLMIFFYAWIEGWVGSKKVLHDFFLEFWVLGVFIHSTTSAKNGWMGW